MRADNITGYFDTRVFKNGVKIQDRPMKGESETIGFTAKFAASELPEQLAVRARKNDKDEFFVSFKISPRAKWFGADGKQTEKPTNAELDGARWVVCIDYRELNGDPSKMEACGYWANGILLQSSGSDMFADIREQHAPEQAPATQTAQAVQPSPVQTAAEQAQPATQQTEDDTNPLPF